MGVLKASKAAQCSGHIPDVTSTLVKDIVLLQLCLITYTNPAGVDKVLSAEVTLAFWHEHSCARCQGTRQNC